MKGRFDLVVGCGVFYEGHVPAAGFIDAYDMLRVGGHFVTSLRKDQYWVNGNEFGYKDAMDKLIEEGKFKMVKDWTHVRGSKNKVEDAKFQQM